MTKHYSGHATIAVLGFLLGAVLAMSIAPGDTLLLIGTGIVFGVSARALFDQRFGADWFWPFGRPPARENLGAKPSTGHRRSSMLGDPRSLCDFKGG